MSRFLGVLLGMIAVQLFYVIPVSSAQTVYGWDFPQIGPFKPAATLEGYVEQLPDADWREEEVEVGSRLYPRKMRTLRAADAVSLGGTSYAVGLFQTGPHLVTVRAERVSDAQTPELCEHEMLALMSVMMPDNGQFEPSYDGHGSILLKCLDDGVRCPDLRRDVVLPDGSGYSTYSVLANGTIFHPDGADDVRISEHFAAAVFRDDTLLQSSPVLYVRSAFTAKGCAVSTFFSSEEPVYAFQFPADHIPFVQVPTIGARHNVAEFLGPDLTSPQQLLADCDVEIVWRVRTVCRKVSGDGMSPEVLEKVKPFADLFVPDISEANASGYSIAIFHNAFSLSPNDRQDLKFSRAVPISFDYAEAQGFRPLMENRDHANGSVTKYMDESMQAGRSHPQPGPVSLLCVVQSDYSLACRHEPEPDTDPWLYNYLFQKASMFLAPPTLKNGRDSVGQTVQLIVRDYSW